MTRSFAACLPGRRIPEANRSGLKPQLGRSSKNRRTPATVSHWATSFDHLSFPRPLSSLPHPCATEVGSPSPPKSPSPRGLIESGAQGRKIMNPPSSLGPRSMDLLVPTEGEGTCSQRDEPSAFRRLWPKKKNTSGGKLAGLAGIAPPSLSYRVRSVLYGLAADQSEDITVDIDLPI